MLLHVCITLPCSSERTDNMRSTRSCKRRNTTSLYHPKTQRQHIKFRLKRKRYMESKPKILQQYDETSCHKLTISIYFKSCELILLTIKYDVYPYNDPYIACNTFRKCKRKENYKQKNLLSTRNSNQRINDIQQGVSQY